MIDSLCQVYTATSGIFYIFLSYYDNLNEYASYEMRDFCNRLVQVRNSITVKSNEFLSIVVIL